MAQNVTTEQLQQALEQLAAQQGQSVHEYVQSQGFAKEADVQAKINDVISKVDAISKLETSDAEKVAEQISAIQDVLNKEDGAVQQILNKIADNAKAISDNNTKIDSNFKLLSDALNTVKKAVDANSKNIEAVKGDVASVTKKVSDVETTLDGKIKEVKTVVDTLKGDETVDGSIASMLKAEADRAKAVETELNKAIASGDADAIKQAVAQAKAYTDDVTKNIVENSDFASNKVVKGIQDNISKINSILNDSTDKDGNLVPGLVSTVKANTAKIQKEVADRTAAVTNAVAEAKAYTDANTLNAKDLNIEVIVNVFTKALNGEATSTKSTAGNSNTDNTSDGSL